MTVLEEPKQIVKLSSKGQLVIPSQIRKALNLQAGAEFLVEFKNQQIVLTLRPAPHSAHEVIDALYGILAGEPLIEMLEEDHRQEIARDEERIARFMGNFSLPQP
jgi:AbrB family looped-hinge helix DNA binding protein